MQTIAEIENRIHTAESLKTIVSTVRTLALVNLRRFEKALEALGEYNNNVHLAIHVCLDAMGQWHDPPRGRAQAQSPGVAVLLGSDQGLCGQFNDRVEQHARRILGDEPWAMLIMGRRLGERMMASGHNVLAVVDAPANVDSITLQARRLLAEIEKMRASGKCCRLYLVYNEHIANVQYRETHLHLLPFDPLRFRTMPSSEEAFRTIPQTSLDPSGLLAHLLPEYLLSQICLAIGESLASESSARLLAMDGASRNIEERVSELRAEYHRRRQEEITIELMDVLTGAAAVEEAVARKGTWPR